MKKTANGTTVLYYYGYDGNLISGTDGAGNPLRDYVWLNGEPAVMKIYGTGAGWYYFLNDHLGTPQKVVDASGSVVWEAGYMPFGEARVKLADIVNNLRFPGQYFDAETGLHYNWHRYYDPDTGRYLTPDPIGLDGGMNLYVYVDGNPVNRIDPYGLSDIALTPYAVAAAPAIAMLDSPFLPFADAFAGGLIALSMAHDNMPNGSCPMPGGDNSSGSPDPDDNEHFKQRKKEAREGDIHREIGESDRTVREGREFLDSETGNIVHVRGNRIVITDKTGRPITQFKNTRANTQMRIMKQKWIPK